MAAEAAEELFEEDGTTYKLNLSAKPSEQNGGYQGVQKKGNTYYAKITPAPGAAQQFIPNVACKTAQLAALGIAKYWAAPYPIEKKDPDRAGKGFGKVRRLKKRLAAPC